MNVLSRILRGSSGVLICVALSAPLSAAAEEPAVDSSSDRARDLFERGLATWSGGDPEGARQLFIEAWELSRSFDVAGNLGHVELELGRYREAAEHLDYSVRHWPVGESRTLLEDMRGKLKQAKAHVGTVRISVDPPDAHILVDDVDQGIVPAGGNVYVEPGLRTFQAEREGAASEHEFLKARAGEEYTLNLALPRDSASGSPSQTEGAGLRVDVGARDSLSDLKWPVVVTGASLAVVGLGVGTYFLVQKGKHSRTGADLRRDFPSDSCAGTTTPRCDDLRGVANDGKQATSLAWGGLAAGGVLAVGTALAWWLWPESSSKEVAVRALPLADAGGNTGSFWGGVLTGTF